MESRPDGSRQGQRHSFWALRAATLSAYVHTALDFMVPAECQACCQFLGDQRVAIFCRACWDAIPVITEPYCLRCGLPFPPPSSAHPTGRTVCGGCRRSAPFFDRAWAAAYYDGVMQEAILHFKFKHKDQLGRPLAQIMLDQFPANLDLSPYDLVLPVPLHISRQRQRGYNQAAILAKHLAKCLHLPLMRNNLRRIRPTSPQTSLTSRKARLANVKDAFWVARPTRLRGRNVILVDDVMTTGVTVNECARTLKKAGVRSVLVLALSRRVLSSSQPQHS